MSDKIIWTHRLNGPWRVRKTLDFARAKSLENAFPEKSNLKKWHLELVTFSEKRIPVSTYFVFFFPLRLVYLHYLFFALDFGHPCRQWLNISLGTVFDRKIS